MGKAAKSSKRTVHVKGISFVKAGEFSGSDEELPTQRKLSMTEDPGESEDDEDEEEVQPPPKKKKKSKTFETDAPANAELEQTEIDRVKKEKKRKKKEALAKAQAEEAEEAELVEVPEQKKKGKNANEQKEAAPDERTQQKKQKRPEPDAEVEDKKKDTKKKSSKEEKSSKEKPAVTDKHVKHDTLFVSGIPWDCEESKLRKDFSECGRIKFMNMPMNDQGKPRGIAFITFKGGVGVDEAIQRFDGLEYGGRSLSVKRADAKGKGKGKAGKDKGNKAFEVFVCGLPFDTDEAVLKKDFEECGEIASLNMLKKPDGSCRGVAFITYKDMNGVEKACEYNGTDYGGRWIQVEKSGASKGGAKGERKSAKSEGKVNGEDSQDKDTGNATGVKSKTFASDSDGLDDDDE